MSPPIEIRELRKRFGSTVAVDGLTFEVESGPELIGRRGSDTLGDVPVCAHLDQITVDVPDQVEGCEECLKIGATWVHLRVCRTCGKVGCCDSSPNRHASKHVAESDHPIVSSLEPGEDWSYCYVDDVAFVV